MFRNITDFIFLIFSSRSALKHVSTKISMILSNKSYGKWYCGLFFSIYSDKYRLTFSAIVVATNPILPSC